MLEMTESHGVRKVEEDTRAAGVARAFEERSVQRDAVMGGQMRIFSHELRNLLAILDLATQVEGETLSSRQVAMVRRAVDYGKRLNALVLEGAQSTAERRQLRVSELIDDLELLVAREVRSLGIRWEVGITPDTGSLRVLERAGSTYFILHNLVRSACERHAARFDFSARDMMLAGLEFPDDFRPWIRLHAEPRGNELLVRVEDNAGSAKRPDSRSAQGSLGLKFVQEECFRNGFRLEAAADDGSGNGPLLFLPLASCAACASVL
jgi:signal transduction histidine kinase